MKIYNESKDLEVEICMTQFDNGVDCTDVFINTEKMEYDEDKDMYLDTCDEIDWILDYVNDILIYNADERGSITGIRIYMEITKYTCD